MFFEYIIFTVIVINNDEDSLNDYFVNSKVALCKTYSIQIFGSFHHLSFRFKKYTEIIMDTRNIFKSYINISCVDHLNIYK